MLELKCDRCGRELEQPGALLFSPPKNDGWLVEKFHLCVECYAAVVQSLKTFDKEQGERADVGP